MLRKYANIILLDADVLIHFFKARELQWLPSIFPAHQYYILENVYEELRYPAVRTAIDLLVADARLHHCTFPEDLQILQAYAHLRERGLGDGESACLAVARYHRHVIASSNLRDIRKYCHQHQIHYLTTMDFLCAALQNGLFDRARCDAFIRLAREQGSRLPVKEMEAYDCGQYRLTAS